MVRRSEYELVIIAHPQLGDDEEGLPALMARVQGWIEAVGGELTYSDVWGRRRLAYPILKQTEGSYVLLRTWLPHEAIVALERELKLADDILRYLLVRAETPLPAKPAESSKPAQASGLSDESEPELEDDDGDYDDDDDEDE